MCKQFCGIGKLLCWLPGNFGQLILLFWIHFFASLSEVKYDTIYMCCDFLLKSLTLLARQFSISKLCESPITSPFGKMVKMNIRAVGAMSDFTGRAKEKLPFTGAQREWDKMVTGQHAVTRSYPAENRAYAFSGLTSLGHSSEGININRLMSPFTTSIVE